MSRETLKSASRRKPAAKAATDPIAEQELRELFEGALPGATDAEIKKVAAIRADVRLYHARLDSRLKRGAIDAAEYADALNAEANRSMLRCADVLGVARCKTLFGDDALDEDSLVITETVDIAERSRKKSKAAPSKSEVVAQICKDAELSRKQVAAVFEALNAIIKRSFRDAGTFTFPGLLKMKVVKKPATKARQGINPFTKENRMFKAKPASKKVLVLPLKRLKALIE